MAWVRRLLLWVPVTALSQEMVRFDTQALQNPEISGVAYQRGALVGDEVREYLVEESGRMGSDCAVAHVGLALQQMHH